MALTWHFRNPVSRAITTGDNYNRIIRQAQQAANSTHTPVEIMDNNPDGPPQVVHICNPDISSPRS